MAKVELIMPKMGESIMEATILSWNKQVGDAIELDETVLEIATDKVDSEIPSPVAGTLVEILYPVDAVVEIGKAIAIIATEGEDATPSPSPALAEKPESSAPVEVAATPQKEEAPAPAAKVESTEDRFYSPLVKNIAKKEGISQSELDAIVGSGAKGRVTKNDVMTYLSSRSSAGPAPVISKAAAAPSPSPAAKSTPPAQSVSGATEIVEMDRMRKMIAEHMVRSKHTSPHVTSFVEADVTDIVNWRNGVKKEFIQKYGEKITFTPIFIEAVAKALADYPMINVSVEGDTIVVKKDFNIGMAAALPSGNLIVPVIKGANFLNLVGLTKQVNDLATRARSNKLKPDEIQGGTFTVTNVGTFGNVMGTPIINQPQVAILAVGTIKKKPAVLETEHGDVIAIRHMMYLSLSYDHRVVDGALGGSFLRRIADYLEAFDTSQTI